MKLTTKLKEKTQNVFNLTKEQFSKTFDFAKIQNAKLKSAVNDKIQERAILNLKAELVMRHKTFDDYTDEELEIMISSEKRKIKDDLKTKSLVGALALLGLDFLI